MIDAARVPFLDAVQDVSSGNTKVPASRFLPSGALAVVDQGQRLIAGYTDDLVCQVSSEPPIIVFGDHTRALKYVDFPFAMGADGVKLLRVREGFEPRFVYHFLRFSDLPSAGYSRHYKYLKELTVPKPSLREQRRLASILDRAEALREKRRMVLDKFEDVRRSVFRTMVGPDYWRAVTASSEHRSGQRWSSLTEVAELATGHTPDRNRSDFWGGDIPWISLPEIRALDGREANDTEVHISHAGVAHSSAVVLPEGTVCFSRTASVGFVTKMGRPMATSQDFHNWIPGECLDPDYLMAALRFSRDHLLQASDGSIHKTIYQRTAQRFRVLLLPIEDQQFFGAISARIDAEASKALRGLGREDELFESLRARAFRGDL